MKTGWRRRGIFPRARTASIDARSSASVNWRSSGSFSARIGRHYQSDSDRSFYDEVNRRLTETGRGVDDTLFLNAQNWQTIPRIAGPLRRVGIPAAAVLDFDVLANDQNWSDIFDMLNLSPDKHTTALESGRATCKSYLDAIPDQPGKKKPFKTEGMYALTGNERDATEKLLDRLASYGVFVVPIGELERWLQSHSIQGGRKNEWLVNAFRAMGSDPMHPQYLKPGNGDVWSFIDKISRWTKAPPAREFHDYLIDSPNGSRRPRIPQLLACRVSAQETRPLLGHPAQRESPPAGDRSAGVGRGWRGRALRTRRDGR